MIPRLAVVILTLLALAAVSSPLMAKEEDPELIAGNRLIAKGEYEQALAHFEKLHQRNPDDPVPLRRLSYIRMKMANFEEALSLANRALKAEDGFHSVAFFLKGKALEGLGKPMEARSAYETGASAGYKTGDRAGILGTLFAHFNAGLQASLAGDEASAIDHFGETLKLDKKNAYANYELALIAEREGRGDDALAFYQEALSNKTEWIPQEMWVYPVQRYAFFAENVKVRMAPLLLERDRAGEVVELLEPVHQTVSQRAKSKRVEVQKDPLAGEFDPSFENAGFWLASAMEALGQRAEARTMFKEWSRLRCGSDELRDECKQRVKALK